MNAITADTDLLDIGRDVMRDMLLRIAAMRDADEQAATDPRYANAAGNLRLLAATMRDVPDDLLLDVAALNEATGGLVGQLISARLCAIGFEVGPFESATAFYRGFIALAEEAAARVKSRRVN